MRQSGMGKSLSGETPLAWVPSLVTAPGEIHSGVRNIPTHVLMGTCCGMVPVAGNGSHDGAQERGDRGDW